MRNSKRLRTGFLVAVMAAVLAVCGMAFAAPANATPAHATSGRAASTLATSAGAGTTRMTATPHSAIVFWLKNNNTGLCMDDSSAYGLRHYGCNSPSRVSGYQTFTSLV